LYRGFRLERGLALGNMVKVLRVLGFRLIVEVRPEVSNGERAIESVAEGNPRKNQFATARRFTAAFKKGEMDALVSVFRETLLSQENVAEFASKTIRSRESLYRAFTKNPMPRFSTLLSFLNALGLRFAVRRLPRPRNSRTTLA
jgi:DNA-binding phage protein